MKKGEIMALFKSFEDAVCKVEETECWSARELQKLLGYSLWQSFVNVVNRAKDSCENVGHLVVDHFIDVNKMIIAGNGAENEIDDISLRKMTLSLLRRGVTEAEIAILFVIVIQIIYICN